MLIVYTDAYGPQNEGLVITVTLRMVMRHTLHMRSHIYIHFRPIVAHCHLNLEELMEERLQ